MTLRPDNPLRTALMSVLIFEVVVFWLALFGMIQVEDVGILTAIGGVSAASVLAIAAAGGLRRGWGYWIGWLTQVAAIALGILTPWMYAMGIVFAMIWTMSFVLGKRLEARSSQP
ncbi:MAG: DUF4233 domain-containing protein [Arachnia sp.]